MTNRQGYDTSSRQIVGLMDLGEQQPYNSKIHSLTGIAYPFNTANTEYTSIVNDPTSRDPTTAINKLNSLGLVQVQDFETVYARKLGPSEYYYNPQVGFISLNQTLQPNDVLAVAYQYSYNGQIYQVGEFASDVPPDTAAANPLTGLSGGATKVLISQIVESYGTADQPADLEPDDEEYLFADSGRRQLVVEYHQDRVSSFQSTTTSRARGTKNYLPSGPKTGIPLIYVIGPGPASMPITTPARTGISTISKALRSFRHWGRSSFPCCSLSAIISIRWHSTTASPDSIPAEIYLLRSCMIRSRRWRRRMPMWTGM